MGWCGEALDPGPDGHNVPGTYKPHPRVERPQQPSSLVQHQEQDDCGGYQPLERRVGPQCGAKQSIEFIATQSESGRRQAAIQDIQADEGCAAEETGASIDTTHHRTRGTHDSPTSTKVLLAVLSVVDDIADVSNRPVSIGFFSVTEGCARVSANHETPEGRASRHCNSSRDRFVPLLDWSPTDLSVPARSGIAPGCRNHKWSLRLGLSPEIVVPAVANEDTGHDDPGNQPSTTPAFHLRLCRDQQANIILHCQ